MVTLQILALPLGVRILPGKLDRNVKEFRLKNFATGSAGRAVATVVFLYLTKEAEAITCGAWTAVQLGWNLSPPAKVEFCGCALCCVIY